MRLNLLRGDATCFLTSCPIIEQRMLEVSGLNVDNIEGRRILEAELGGKLDVDRFGGEVFKWIFSLSFICSIRRRFKNTKSTIHLDCK